MNVKNFVAAIFGNRKTESSQTGFGTFYGVYLPGVLSMFGVILYLRFGWIIGSLGLFQTIAVVTLACFIVFVTVLSIASAATNMHVGGGGTYYMVSRSLGIEIGSAIGIPLFIAQALTISFCAVGFAESIQPYFPEIPLTYLGAATIVGLMALVFSSASIALKTQFIIFLIILGSLVSLLLGKQIVVESSSEATVEILATPFWAGFALFFPATTGVEAGVSMSGNLRSPRKSLPLGTICVLLSGFTVYFFLPFFLWARAPRSVLISDGLLFQHIALFQPLIIGGIWAATLSSILSGLLAAPRTLQALAVDGVVPQILAKESGKAKEPRIAILISFVIAMVGVFYGSIDAIAPILTMFYLIAYATLNLATGLEGLLGNPSWRPTFRVHWTISIAGVVLCLLAMFMIDAGATFIALFFVIAIYAYMRKRNLAKKWEDILHGVLVFLSRFAIYKLAHKEQSIRSWRPNLLVLSSSPMAVGHLLNVSAAITEGKGFLTLASVFSPNIVDHDRAERWKKIVNAHLHDNRIEALVEFCMDESLLSGAKSLLTNYGMGSISPNTLVMGEMKNQGMCDEYLEVIHSAHQAKKNVVLIRDKQTEYDSHQIHIWWDDLYRPNSELMLLLSHMLCSNKKYRKSKIYLNSIVSSESGKEQRLKYFHDFFAKGRLSVTPNIFIMDKDGCASELMTRVSADADLVFIGIDLSKVNESMDVFKDYYSQLVEGTSSIPNAVFVSCSEFLDVSEIFN